MASVPFSLNVSTLKSLLAESWKEWNEDEATRLGASLAYYTVLSLAPLLIVVIGIAGLAFGREAVQGQLMYQIQGMVGQEGGEAIQSMVKGASSKSGGIIATVIGFLALLFGASSVVAELRSSMNKIWDIPQKDQSWTDMFKERAYALAVVLGTGFLLLVSLVLSAGLAAAGKFFGGLLPIPEPVMLVINLVISFAVITFVFALMFKVLPETAPAWRDVLLGAAFTALLFTLGKLVIGLYLGKASFGSTFGAAGSLVIVLVWVYYSSQIFFFGAEFTQVYARRYGTDPAAKMRKKREHAEQTGRPKHSDAPAYTRQVASGHAGLPPVGAVHENPTPEQAGPVMNTAVALGSVAGIGIALLNAFKRKG